MAQIDKLGREQAIELAKRMRAKARNAEFEGKKAAKRLTGVASSAGGAYLLGGFMARKEADYLENKAAVDQGEMSDPRQMFGVDYEWVAGFGLSALGLLMQAGTLGKGAKGIAADVVEGVGSGCLAAAAYQLGRDHAMPSSDE